MEDVPKCGIYTEVEDEEKPRVYEKHYNDAYELPELPLLGLSNPNFVLEGAINNAK